VQSQTLDGILDAKRLTLSLLWYKRRFVLCDDGCFRRYEGDHLRDSSVIASDTVISKIGSNEFTVTFHQPSLHYHLRAGSSVDRDRWVAALSSAIRKTMPDFYDFEIFGLPVSFFRELIDGNGCEAAFEGMTTSNVKRSIIVPKTQATQLSLCAQMRREGDARVQNATWFVSHAWQMKFLDLVRALEAFFKDKPGAIIWIDLFSTSQHATFDRGPEWWQQTFMSAIGRMGRMVMVMTPWDNPICLTRAWCLIELYACRSSRSTFAVAFPPSERVRFLEQISERGDAFYDMLRKVNTAKSECSRESDRDRIFDAVRTMDGGFTALDRSVLQTMTDWLQQQLEEDLAAALTVGQVDVVFRMKSALGGLFHDKGEYDLALPLYVDCLSSRQLILGDDHPDTLRSLKIVAQLFRDKNESDLALPLYEECLARCNRVLGDHDTFSLSLIYDLADLYERKGEDGLALSLYEQCLKKRKLFLGLDHIDTRKSMDDFALLLYNRGEFDAALPLFDENLLQRQMVLGVDHPDTLRSLHGLAQLFTDMGNYDLALPLYEECLLKSKLILGDNHPTVLLALKNVLKLRQHFELISDSFEEEETLLSEEQMKLDFLEFDVFRATQALSRVDDDSFISVPVSGGQSWQDARSALERNRDELAEYLEQQKIAVGTHKHRGLRPCLIFPCSFTSIRKPWNRRRQSLRPQLSLRLPMSKR
jgi:tetratricopeptide (TPR) repeat protein